MGTTARSRLMTFLPWIALVAVTIFAFAQMRARRTGEADAPPATGPATGPAAEPATGPTVTAAPARAATEMEMEALRAADTALDEALQDLAGARARVQEIEAAQASAVARAETAEARLDATTARLGAAESDLDTATAEVTRLEREVAPLLQRVVALEERRKIVEDKLLRMLSDATTEDAERTKRAHGVAGRLDAEDVERLAALVLDDPTRAAAAADLLSAVPPSEAADALVAAVLSGLEPGEAAPSRLARLGRDHLVRPTLLLRVLDDAGLGAWHPFLLTWLGRHASALEDEAREALAHPLAARLLGDDVVTRGLALRLMGILRQDGQATSLAPFLRADDAAVRAAAAYALSRVPDREDVEQEAWAAVPSLLGDASLEVRTAGALLAEAILGQPVAFDPAADEPTRGKQLEALPAKP